MPKVREGEKRSDYVARCTPICMKEGLSQEQAVGKCEGLYSSHKRGGMVKAIKGKE